MISGPGGSKPQAISYLKLPSDMIERLYCGQYEPEVVAGVGMAVGVDDVITLTVLGCKLAIYEVAGSCVALGSASW